MAAHSSDAELPRSVALQNAPSKSLSPTANDADMVHAHSILERKSDELARSLALLRQSEQELADFFENSSVGFHWVGPDGIILRVNRAELAMLGYAPEEYIGHHIAEFHVDQEVITDCLQRLAAGETLQNREARMRCKDGSVKHVLIDSSVLWEEGRFVHTRCFTRDNTDRKRMEETQARLAAIVESSQDVIISKTLESRITSWNAAAERLFGYTAAEMVGQSILRLIPAELQHEEQMILDRLSRGERIEHYETIRVTKDGRRIDLSLSISPIRDQAGRIIGAAKIARDITASKRAEQRLLTQSAVTRALAESATLAEAAPRMLQPVCEHLGWTVGAIWYVDPDSSVLRCAEVWHKPANSVLPFAAASRDQTFAQGVGLPGRVWHTRQAAWIPDVLRDDNFPRAPVAAAAGLHGACGFPILLHEEFLGVIEFFSQEIRSPDADLLQMMTIIGSQIGQFLERQRAEAALRESERRFRLMAESIPSIIWTAAPEGTITYANPRWFEYCGLTPDANRRSWPELVLHPEDRDRCVAAWSAALRAGTEYEIEVRNRRYDGVYRWFVTRAVPFRDAAGTIVQWFGTTTDIEDRKRAEESSRFLAEASATLAELTDYKSTLQRVAALAVPAFADWCAVDMLDADGTVRRLAVAHSDSGKVRLVQEREGQSPAHAVELPAVRHVIRTGEPRWAAALPEELPGTVAHGEESLRSIRDLGLKSYVSVPLKSRSKVLGALTFALAESGRVYDATALAAADDLAHRTVIAIENANLLATLKEADRRKDEFLAMLAHELRNPLAPIRNAVQIFRGKGPPIPELQWATEVIDRQIHQMTRLVDDLLDVSRITRGKIELRKERVTVASVVQSAVEASRPLLEKWGHTLTVTLPPQPLYLDADATRLSQVVLNLLNNAAKYTNQGGQIKLAAEVQGGQVCLRVKDNGIGIPAQMLPRIFDMFMQVDPALERSEGGLGIGLTLVQRLVEMHGGTVEAHSEGPGRGSEFLVRLPLARVSDPAATSGTGSTETIGPAPCRILVVDDNRDAADSLGMLLRLLGHDVHTAYDGLEAVGAAATFQPDVVLMDIGLPKLNGYDAARRIRTQPGGTTMTLIALTGWGQEEDRRRSKEAGFDHHLTKPVEFPTLQQLLTEREAGR